MALKIIQSGKPPEIIPMPLREQSEVTITVPAVLTKIGEETISVPAQMKVPARPIFDVEYENNLRVYLADCAKEPSGVNKLEQYKERLLYYVSTYFEQGITNPHQLWQSAERTASRSLEAWYRGETFKDSTVLIPVAEAQNSNELKLAYNAKLAEYRKVETKLNTRSKFMSEQVYSVNKQQLLDLCRELTEMLDLLPGATTDEVLNGFAV